MIYGNIDSPKKAEKESNSGGKTKIYDYFGSRSEKDSELAAVAVPNNELQVEIVVPKAVAVCQSVPDIHSNYVPDLDIIQVQSPNQPRCHSFPKRTFGKTSKKEFCVQSSWFDKYSKYSWLHYDENQTWHFVSCASKRINMEQYYHQNLIKHLLIQALPTGKMQEGSFPHTKLVTLTNMLTEQDFQILKA